MTDWTRDWTRDWTSIKALKTGTGEVVVLLNNVTLEKKKARYLGSEILFYL